VPGASRYNEGYRRGKVTEVTEWGCVQEDIDFEGTRRLQEAVWAPSNWRPSPQSGL